MMQYCNLSYLGVLLHSTYYSPIWVSRRVSYMAIIGGTDYTHMGVIKPLLGEASTTAPVEFYLSAFTVSICLCFCLVDE